MFWTTLAILTAYNYLLLKKPKYSNEIDYKIIMKFNYYT